MSNSARSEVLHNHSQACWRVLQKHWDACYECWAAMENRTLPNRQCLVGTAAYEEWCIADRRYSEQLAVEKVQGMLKRD